MNYSKKASSKKQQILQQSKITQSENVHSLNHLYQSAAFLTLQSAAFGIFPDEAIARSVRLQSLTRKATLRIDTDLKKALCKVCSVPLLPGLTVSTRSRTFPPTSRAVQTKCLVCSYSISQIAPPNGIENSNKASRRRKKTRQWKGVRFFKDKVARICRRKTSSISQIKAAIMEFGEREFRKELREAPKRRWSQRERRRAGRAKAQMSANREIVINVKGAVIALDTGRLKGEMIGRSPLPLYKDRLNRNTLAWNNIWPGSTISAEKEAINTLRGNHVVTSGVGRGGAAGKELS